MTKVMKLIDYTSDDQVLESSVALVATPLELKAILHPLKYKILQALSIKPMFPKELADYLSDNAGEGKPNPGYYQKIYYHIRELEKQNFVTVVDRVQKRGATAVYYRTIAPVFGITVGNLVPDGVSTLSKQSPEQTFIGEFFAEFQQNGVFNGYIVVGSPDEHIVNGESVRARDGHYAAQLALLLGRNFSFETFVVKLDVDVVAEQRQDNNLCVIGGPITNLITAAINDKLPVKFVQDQRHIYLESPTGKRYTDDTVGVIAKIPNPLNPAKCIIVIAGKREIGTKAAIMALTQNPRENLAGLLQKNYIIIRGLIGAKSGFIFKNKTEAGKLDAVEILE